MHRIYYFKGKKSKIFFTPFQAHPFNTSSSSQLVIRRTRLFIFGDRAFPVAGNRLWNSLPHDERCFPAPRQNLSLFPILSFLTVFGF